MIIEVNILTLNDHQGNIIIIHYHHCYQQVSTTHDGDHDVRVIAHVPKVSQK